MKREPKKTQVSKGQSGGARMAPAETVTVLHIEDDPNDTELLKAAQQKAGVNFRMHNVEDGEQAVAYLSGTGIFADRKRYPMPALIILDLKLPRATGFEILKWIRARTEWRTIPVVVLSGSELQDDKHRAFAGGANSYHVKPLGFDALVSLVKEINFSWLSGQQTLPLQQSWGSAAHQ